MEKDKWSRSAIEDIFMLCLIRAISFQKQTRLISYMLTCLSIYRLMSRALILVFGAFVRRSLFEETKNNETELRCKQKRYPNRRNVGASGVCHWKLFSQTAEAWHFSVPLKHPDFSKRANPKLESRRRKIVSVECHSSPITRALQFFYRSRRKTVLPISPQ